MQHKHFFAFTLDKLANNYSAFDDRGFNWGFSTPKTVIVRLMEGVGAPPNANCSAIAHGIGWPTEGPLSITKNI